MPANMGFVSSIAEVHTRAARKTSCYCDEFGLVESFLKRDGSYSSSPVIP